MKTIYLFLLLLTGLFAKAQKEALIANDWQLSKTIINGIEYPYTIPSGSEYTGVAKFYEDVFFTGFCFSTDFVINYTSNNTFTLGSGGGVFDCHTSYDQYFRAVFGNAIGIRPFSYLFQTANNKKWLIITNEIGNKAIYSSLNLAVSDENLQKVNVYPNPVKDQLTIKTNDKIEKVEIYSQTGQLVTTADSKEINTSTLPKGNYILKIKTDKSTVTEKLIKN